MHPLCAARERDGYTPLSELNDTALQLLKAPQPARWTMNPVRIPAAASPCTPSIGRLATVEQDNRRYDGGVAASVDVGHMSHIGTRRTRQQWVARLSFRLHPHAAEPAFRRNDCYKAADRQGAREEQH